MMKRKITKVFSILLAAGLLLGGCGEATNLSGGGAVETSAVAAGNGQAPEWTKDAVLYEVNVRQYTSEGTFNAFAEHLGELKEMGINTLWFMPVHPISETNRSGSLGSYYSATDYRAINPEFGTMEDFKTLVSTAHEMGFHVMLDWVANHTGWDSAWITEHPDWYTQKDGKIISPEGMGWPDVADLNYDNADMRAEMIDCMRFWIEECDIDGFRCDFAQGVPADFWAQARAELEQIKPLYFIEEELGGTNGVLLEQAFDTNYAAKFYETLVLVSKGGKTANKLKIYFQKMPEGDFPMFYLDNHDVNSYDRTIAEAFPAETMPAMYSLIFTLPGIPMIYSGDEIGYNKAIAFMEKDTIRWNSGTGDYRPLIRALSKVKGAHEALNAGQYGAAAEYPEAGNSNLFVYRREMENDSILCIFNLSAKEIADIDLSEILPDSGQVIFSGRGESWTEGGEMPAASHTFAPWEFYIISGGSTN